MTGLTFNEGLKRLITFLDDSELSPSLDVSGRICRHALVDAGIKFDQTQNF